MSETVLRVGLKLKEYGINDLGVCYCKVQRDAAIATKERVGEEREQLSLSELA